MRLFWKITLTVMLLIVLLGTLAVAGILSWAGEQDAVRIVVDVGDWDQSRCINAPGQSGDPRSPHYRDLAPLWADGHYVPLLYTRAAVDAAAETIITLKPAR